MAYYSGIAGDKKDVHDEAFTENIRNILHIPLKLSEILQKKNNDLT